MLEKIKDSNLFIDVYPHPTPHHPLIKNNPKMKGVWVADVNKTNYIEAKRFLSENNIRFSQFNNKKNLFIWLNI